MQNTETKARIWKYNKKNKKRKIRVKKMTKFKNKAKCTGTKFIILFNFPISRPPLQVLSNPTLSSSPNYPLKSNKFTTLPLLRLNHLCNRSTASYFSSSSSMEAPPERYRRNVGICIINPSKKIFAASRLDIPDSWQMPQGGIDENEDPRDAAIRELREETGITSAEVLAEDAEINLLGNGTEKAEFGAWSWMSPEQAVDFKKPIYREVLTAFSPHLQ
ncbi:hypothetical protein HYC85_000464 [Camellia sinensis]|uniref:Nudix hydrolase domain-containing protein n=1 Tax=Camellia sinensis TaxID=4442 RepID=A0A7J7I3E2_CAMSI|nr:hypothetical protein HYC85_000464 [Camellia sinensis]